MRMLDVKDLYVSYGAIQAVKGVSFHLEEGEIVALIGSNGAGKTTILRTISGLEKAKAGTILLEDKEITHMKPHDIVKRGIAHVPEGRRVFAKLTVHENLMLGGSVVKNSKNTNEMLEEVFDIFPRLKEREKQMAGTLSGGEQQMLAVGRALMTRGRVMLMDEPSMGLAPILVEGIFKVIERINKAGTSILLIEQNAFLALSIANRAYVLETGHITIEGEGHALLRDDRVKAAYLGA
ncbi:MAG: ABC transporter ATP-binding protein [Candidatus Hydrogenedentes bacterium]|nr:ABC transporter ATP-binding protein [Candidatus Hydrogenedentota bacterium]